MSEITRPVLRIVRGEPTAEELAVIAALVSAAGEADAEPTPPLRGRWNDPAQGLRRPLLPGHGAWRSSVR
jgi:hypothetical protein